MSVVDDRGRHIALLDFIRNLLQNEMRIAPSPIILIRFLSNSALVHFPELCDYLIDIRA